MGLKYYQEMGALAYSSVTQLQVLTKESVFHELSQRFVLCSEILRDVYLRLYRRSADLIELYEEWLKNNDPSIRRRLMSLGFGLETEIIA